MHASFINVCVSSKVSYIFSFLIIHKNLIMFNTLIIVNYVHSTSQKATCAIQNLYLRNLHLSALIYISLEHIFLTHRKIFQNTIYMLN